MRAPSVLKAIRFGAHGRTIVLGLLLCGAALVLALGHGALVRGSLAGYLSHRLQRTVRVDTLSLGLESGRPRASFTGLRIGQPVWAGAGDMIDVPRGRIVVSWSSLVGAPIRVATMELDHPVLRLKADASGRANWRLGPRPADPKPLKLFPIGRLTIADGRIDMDDGRRKLAFSGTLSTEPQGRASIGDLVVAASGRIEGRPFRLDLRGAPISDLVPEKPYPLVLRASDGPTRLEARVALATPFDLGHYSGVVRSSGDDLSALHAMTGAVLPNTPAYDLSAHIQRDLTRYRLTGAAGRVGRSDLSGDVLVDKIDGRRKVQARLSSQRLEFADLTAVIGDKRPDQGGGSPGASPARRERRVRTGAALPTAPLYVARLRSLDAQVRYEAASVSSTRLPLRQLDLGLNLQGGVLAVQPMTFRFTRGVLTGRLRLDARGPTPLTDLNLHLSGFRLEDVLHARGAGVSLQAPVDGHAELHGRGLSVSETAKSLHGRIALAFAPGLMRRSFADLIGGAGVDLGRLLTPRPSQTALRCGLIGLDGEGGRFRLSPAVIDTGVATLRGSGDIDLGAERLDVRVIGFSKRPDVLRILAPITVAGPLAKPRVMVDKTKIAAQTATGMFSALLSPLAGVLPFLKGHAAPDVDCRALLAGYG